MDNGSVYRGGGGWLVGRYVLAEINTTIPFIVPLPNPLSQMTSRSTSQDAHRIARFLSF